MAPNVNRKWWEPQWTYEELSWYMYRQGFAGSWMSTEKESDSERTKFAKRNSLKIRALTALEYYGPMNPPVWAVVVGMTPVRSSYSYLLRLHRWGLLYRGRDQRGFLLYELTEKGRARLAWLRSQPDETQARR